MLVVCKNTEPLENLETTEFKVGKIYRYLEIEDNNEKQYMVFGITMLEKTFKECFDLYAPIIVDRVKQTAFIETKFLNRQRFIDYKPVTKKKFKEDIADVHYYGRGKRRAIVVYVGEPRKSMFAILSNETTKKGALKFAYDVMLELYKGNIDYIDRGFVKWTNRGMPVVYSFDTRTDVEYSTKQF